MTFRVEFTPEALADLDRLFGPQLAQPLHQPEQQQRLASYGEGAVYMARTLQAM